MSSEKPIKFALYLVLDKPEEEKSDSFFSIYYKSRLSARGIHDTRIGDYVHRCYHCKWSLWNDTQADRLPVRKLVCCARSAGRILLRSNIQKATTHENSRAIFTIGF